MIVEVDHSPAQLFTRELVAAHGLEQAHAELDEMFDSMSIVDIAGLEFDWRGVWARPKQLPPPGEWQSWGFLTGRGFGKTICISKWINEEVAAGRAKSICLIAQDEDNTVKLLVNGLSGLIATALPRNAPTWSVSELTLTWPNGAKAYVRTPEVPEKIRGFDYDLAWCAERQSWPKTTEKAAMMNVEAATRIGLAREVWDATAKRGHEVLKKLLLRAAKNPTQHIVVRGSSYENADYLNKNVFQKLEESIGGTRQGEEELHGNMSTDAKGVTAQEAWIERNRRVVVGPTTRHVISIDPAVTSRAGSDSTGIVHGALGVDGKALIIGDHTDRHPIHVWPDIVLDVYLENRCDLIVDETNKGGDMVTQSIRSAAQVRGLQVVVIGKKERAPGHVPGVVHVREIFSRGEKADRARPLSTAIEKDRVKFVGKFPELEDTLTNWEPVPGARSPDRLDATVGLVVELLGLDNDIPNPKKAFEGIVEIAAQVMRPAISRGIAGLNLAALLGGDTGGKI